MTAATVIGAIACIVVGTVLIAICLVDIISS